MIVPWKHNPRYGLELSYIRGMGWLKPCSLVEDWGCALAYAKTYRIGNYRGVDGTAGKADVIADLSTYRSDAPGVFMRHILEHNYDWREILQNALDSFRERMVLILYRPMQDLEKVVLKKPIEIDLPRFALLEMLKPTLRGIEVLDGATHGHETLFYLSK
jgi:hypothetical protein